MNETITSWLRNHNTYIIQRIYIHTAICHFCILSKEGTMSAEQVASALNNCNVTNLNLQDTSLLLVSTVTWVVSQTMTTQWNKVMFTDVNFMSMPMKPNLSTIRQYGRHLV